MFPNLDAEMARRKITRGMLAEKIGKTPTTFPRISSALKSKKLY